MTLTRGTVGELLECNPLMTHLETKLCTILLAAWDERDVLLNRALDEGQILVALRDCEAERDALRAALDADDKMISEITEDVVRWKRCAEAAEDENAELKLDAAARDIRIFELKEELDSAEAKLAEWQEIGKPPRAIKE